MIPGSSPMTVPEAFGPPSNGAFGGAPTGLPKGEEPWTWMVSASALTCRGGKIVPMLAKVPHRAGLGGNGDGPNNRGMGMQSQLQTRGYVAVPHDMKGLTAFGKPLDGATPSVYLTYQPGPTGYRWSDPWTRHTAFGVERDEVGWMDFLAKCLALVSPGDLHPLQIKMALAMTVRAIRRYADREDRRAQRELGVLLTHIPREHAPADVLALMPDEAPKKAPKRKDAPTE